MSTAQQFGDYYYDSRYSPPVSPKSLPHGYKRKASTQDDELEKQSISNTFKKLRLHSAKRASAIGIPPVGIAYRDIDPQQSSSYHEHASGRDLSYLPDAAVTPNYGESEDEGTTSMSVDDTGDRTWVHDLDAEIAEIEAEEARNKSGIQITNAAPDEAQSNMQMILYRDPISISVPEEHDAVRKTIIEARRRMREKQAETQQKETHATLPSGLVNPIDSSPEEDEEDSMDID